jgi:CHAT domain-containing protein
MYRLSSTRELTNEVKCSDTKKCVIYGGIQYDVDNRGNGKEDEETAAEVRNDGNLKSGIAYLPQTLVEMENVSKILCAKYELTGFSGSNATEESFKQLSGTFAIIIHVATHGFYVPKFRKSAITKIIKNPFNSLEDQSLSCSGIMMAGANNTLAKEFLPGDDGILSAKEISRLNLSGIDLVVLSACETGLGDISDEGVFGLQRGFKKAGVNSIMMSLWEVDDEATQVLMSAFYKNLVEGQSKREAFVNAQQYLRITQDKKFDNPRFWAAFIMLDAL